MATDLQLYQNLPLSTTERTLESLEHRVFSAARDGLSSVLFTILAGRPDHEITYLLSHITKENNQEFTPLIIAVMNKRKAIIELLLTKFKPVVDQEGTVRIGGPFNGKATPLWCAARVGDFDIVKLLVSNGAKIDHQTTTKSSPLRAACFDRKLDILRFLLEHGANIDITNEYNSTCLMKAAFKNQKRVVSLLLEKGADLNIITYYGSTALHFAAKRGHVQIVEDLLIKGANILRDNCKMTPLMSAAEKVKVDVVEFIVSCCNVSREEKVLAYELLGASFANNRKNYNLNNAYLFLYKGMRLRFSPSCQPLLKPECSKVEAYDNHTECQTMVELESIRMNEDKLHMESLVIRERILGSHNPHVHSSLIYRGMQFFDVANFDRCVKLFIHALRLRQDICQVACVDLWRLLQVFCRASRVGCNLSFELLSEVFGRGVLELERDQNRGGTPKDGMNESIFAILYLLILVTKSIPKITDQEEMQSIYKQVYKLNSLGLTTCDQKYSLLHLTAHPSLADVVTNGVCSTPNAAAARLLIKCGADLNVLDKNRNTPLHLIADCQKLKRNSIEIIMCLIKSGAHTDIVNNRGLTPLETATNGTIKQILRINSELYLKCIAAKAVSLSNISYIGQIPQTLENFIKYHGVY